MDHIMSELSTMICPSVALHSMAHSFIVLDKAVAHVINLDWSVLHYLGLYFEIIFVYDMRNFFYLILLHVAVSFPITTYWRDRPFSHCLLLLPSL